MHELTSVVFSHYVEKARWALDRFGVPYVEHRYMPLFHFAGVWAAHRGKHGTGDKASTSYSTPVLRTPRGRFLCSSDEIVRYASETFAPDGEELFGPHVDAEMLQRLHDVMGPHSRRVAYDALFAAPSAMRELAERNVGAAQASTFKAMFPLVKSQMIRLLGVDAPRVLRSRQKVRAEMDWLDGLLADGRPYLAGERFSAVDLSAACMMAPGVIPPEYGVWLPPVAALGDDAQSFIAEVRSRPAGAYALRMFEQERGRRVVGGDLPPPVL